MSPSSPRTAARRGRIETTRFRCPCGRSVAAQRGTEAARSKRCSTCRSRQQADPPLHRT